ncbi:hypothetical protein BH09SUM1_BH09SUM1_02040 [soil metagenome]
MRTLRTQSPATPRRASRRRGFSIIELLVAIIIIGILVSVLIPVVASRTEHARQARVNSDLENLAENEERAAVDSGYFIRLFALNDVRYGDGIGYNRGHTTDPLDRADGLTDYKTAVAQPFLNFPTTNSLFIDPESGLFANVNRDNLIDRLVAAETTYDGSLAWHGPYITWTKDKNLYASESLRDGVPDDPWGNNYMLFTRQGLVLEPDGILVLNTSPLPGGGYSNGGTFDCEVFDRATVLSLGPNGLPGNGTTAGTDSNFGRGDDYIRQLGK